MLAHACPGLQATRWATSLGGRSAGWRGLALLD